MPDQLPSVGPVGDLPDAAVELAAKVSFGFVWRTRPIAVSWEDAEESTRREYRADARSVLAAALPLIRAHIADQQQAIVDRERARYDPADNYGEAMEHS